MIYAQFYQQSAISSNLIEACGDRAVVIIDGRLLESVQEAIARQECVRRGYLAYQMFKGDTFTRSTPISPRRSP